ncbi:MAG: type II toxin-antitoxin system death-on-curing family toxin [Desulfovibrionaceae bacterium]
MEPLFLTVAEVLAIHGDQLARYGGAPGVRDMRLLESATAMPAVGVGDGYAHPDLFAMAAAYLFHLVRNHPFVDGNKRTGVVAALLFLDLNGVEIVAPPEALEAMVRSVARGDMDKAAIVVWFKGF